jgi:hypothetical protein
MDLPSKGVDPETLELIASALDAAWEEVAFAPANNDANSTALRALMTARIMSAVRDGEHKPEALKKLAVEAFARK